MVNKFFNVK